MSSASGVQVVLRPLGTVLPLGFLGLFVATLGLSALQLDWVDDEQSHAVALAVLGFTVPAQALTAVLGFLSRDPIAGTGMAVLAGTWAATAVTTLVGPPGSSSTGLGVVLVGSACALLVPAVAGRHKTLAASVMALSAARFLLTAIVEMTGSGPWSAVAGWAGLVLAAASLYAALAFELEGVQHREVVPLWRRGAAARAMDGDATTDKEALAVEPGVRPQL